MSRRCALTGKKTVFGNNVSHSELKTRRKWKTNLIKKKLYLEDEDRWVRIRLSTKALRTITRKMSFSEYCKKHNINTKKFPSA
ncbi:MAG: 50S ribosomal protein L28 [bacterium]